MAAFTYSDWPGRSTAVARRDRLRLHLGEVSDAMRDGGHVSVGGRMRDPRSLREYYRDLLGGEAADVEGEKPCVGAGARRRRAFCGLLFSARSSGCVENWALRRDRSLTVAARSVAIILTHDSRLATAT